jgi:hypothetical protein
MYMSERYIRPISGARKGRDRRYSFQFGFPLRMAFVASPGLKAQMHLHLPRYFGEGGGTVSRSACVKSTLTCCPAWT